MSEPGTPPSAPEPTPEATPTVHHEHVRTEGETTVDDALGQSDDPS